MEVAYLPTFPFPLSYVINGTETEIDDTRKGIRYAGSKYFN